MRSVALVPSVSLLAGVHAGIAWANAVPGGVALLLALAAGAAVAWWRRRAGVVLAFVVGGYFSGGLLLGASAAHAALHAPIRDVLNAAYGGFTPDTLGPPGPHPPLVLRARLVEDAAVRDFGVTLVAESKSLRIHGTTHRVAGGLRLTVLGGSAAAGARRWRAGRIVEAPVTFRRPARYLDLGVPDFERAIALEGVALTGSVKSGLLVQVVAHGSMVKETAADVRAQVREAIARRVGTHDPVAAAIVTAILIGERTALPNDVRERLQAAGTYHVIAISGGNIAILVALFAGACLALGLGPRGSAAAMIAGLFGYAAVVSAGPSVWRATATAIVYLAARFVDHRSPPWNAMAVSAAILACVAPLDVRDVGFALTFGATAGILEAARRIGPIRLRPAAWLRAIVAASCAAELVLLPIGASAFSRVTAAGVLLNVLAVPLMTVTQVAGMTAAALDALDAMAAPAGWLAAIAARAIVDTAHLVDLAPWLVARVPAPHPAVVIVYYAALAWAAWATRWTAVACVLLAGSAALILTGASLPAQRLPREPRDLHLTMFDVGQGEALLVETPGGRALVIDAGGAGFDASAFDIGGRVLAPALWARGIRRLDALAITHGDPDHIGGALAVVRDFMPSTLWLGVPVPGHAPEGDLRAAAHRSGAIALARHAGATLRLDDVEVRVLHPPLPDWERRRVRNDDSLVLAIAYGDAAMLLTGDIGAEVERTLIPHLPRSRIRILKAAHHGSRTSTSRELLEAWKPQIALISCGRGNRFGHPAPDVLSRLAAANVRVLRTDRDGQITVSTDGREVRVRTFVGGGM